MEQPNPQKENDPARLLDGVNRSIFIKGLLISTVAHLVFVFGSSFGLYKDWSTYGMTSEDYGFHTPSKIQTIKRDVAAAKEEADREQKLKERMAEQQAEEAEAPPAPEPTAAAAEPDTPKAPEIEPMAPKESFSLDDMPGLSL